MIKPQDIIESKSIFWVLTGVIILLHMYTNWYGIGLTYDSFHYLKASDDLVSFFNVEIIEDELIKRPPLYPVILSLLFSNLYVIKFFHLTVFLCSLFIFRSILFSLVEKSVFRITGLMLFATSTPILIMHSFVWTESLVMLLVLLQILLLLRYQEKVDIKTFVYILLLGFTLGLIKRGGVLLIPGAAIILIVFQNNWKGVLKSTIYFIFSYSGTYLWYAYLGQGSVPKAKLPEQTEYLNVISTWLVPKSLPVLPREIFIVAFLVFCVICTLSIFQKISRIELRSILLFPCFFICYVLMRWKFASIDYYESDRYISVIIPCFLVWIMWLFSKAEGVQKKLKTGLYVFIVLWISYSGVRVVKNAIQINESRKTLSVHQRL